MTWLAVAIGGALGSMARHGLNHLLHQRALANSFPAGIFVINVLGSAGVGILAGLLVSSRIQLSGLSRTFLVAGQVGFSLLGVWLGFRLAR